MSARDHRDPCMPDARITISATDLDSDVPQKVQTNLQGVTRSVEDTGVASGAMGEALPNPNEDSQEAA